MFFSLFCISLLYKFFYIFFGKAVGSVFIFSLPIQQSCITCKKKLFIIIGLRNTVASNTVKKQRFIQNSDFIPLCQHPKPQIIILRRCKIPISPNFFSSSSFYQNTGMYDWISIRQKLLRSSLCRQFSGLSHFLSRLGNINSIGSYHIQTIFFKI